MTVGLTFTEQLARAERTNDSLLCVGLDPEPAKFPGAWKNDPSRIFDFCSAIVDATHDLAIAFKPQFAHFAAHRAEAQLERLIEHIHRVAPNVPVILDAKRGDIGSTAAQYAVEAFERYRADALTLSPFLGFDSIEPYLRYADKGLILLCRTSNPGGADLQGQRLQSGELLYEHIARLAQGAWNRSGQLGLVVGATFPDEIARVRAIAPTLPLLIPGIGAQGGDALATVRAGWRAWPGAATGAATDAAADAAAGAAAQAAPVTTGPIIVSSSRAILYAEPAANEPSGTGRAFAMRARQAAAATRDALNQARSASGGRHHEPGG
ncbi:MAG: Orotidine 5'-phosphate decarboxylase [Methylibium sp. NZG]|nr:MAG: Orotidine 5'-phosphate decarboxylase [Methylibium sp. NZG]